MAQTKEQTKDYNTDPEFQSSLRQRLAEMGFDYNSISRTASKKGVKGAWKGYKPTWQYDWSFRVYWETPEKPNGTGKKYKHFRDCLKWCKRMDEAGYFNIHISYLDPSGSNQPYWYQYHEGNGKYSPKIYIPLDNTGDVVMYDVFKEAEAKAKRLRAVKEQS